MDEENKENNPESKNTKEEEGKPAENAKEEEKERNQEGETTKEEGREPEDERSKKEEGESTETCEIISVELKKPMLKEIRGNPVWLR